MSAPKMNPEEIHERINNLARSPFREQAARWLANGPTDESLAALAQRSPDRWTQGLAIVARLAGYTEKLELEATVSQRIDGLSDGELLAEITKLRSALEK